MLTTRFAVLGDPIAHSLSPTLHQAGFAALELSGCSYLAYQVSAGGLSEFLATSDCTGLSLTMPLKREAMTLANSLSPRATLAGAANTLVRTVQGWHGDNTDLPGAAAAIRERTQLELRRVAIWGGGATAASTLLAAAELGCRQFELLVRDPARAADTLAAAARFSERLDVVVGQLGDPVSADLLISTIPATAQTDLLSSVRSVPAIFEVIYHPWPTPLASWAGELPVVSGLDLLVHQAALQFEIFTGRAAPLAEMRAAGETALAQRFAAS